MGKRVDPRNKISQRSIGFPQRQIEFFDALYDEGFKPDLFCRKAIDEQIKLSGRLEFLDDEEKKD